MMMMFMVKISKMIKKQTGAFFLVVYVISWLTVSNKIVKSLSLSYKKFYFFNMVQPIDLIFCKMVEIIEQNIFNRADFLFRS